MSRFAIIVLCVHACLIQIALSQSGCSPFSYGPSTPSALSYSAPNCGYGGTGTGQVGVSGNIDASGNTVVVGSVPVLGSVDFSGTVPASGAVSISGQCGCGCS